MEPLTPPECDLQDFAFMPLQVARLRDSDLAATESPEACWYAVLLWSAAWHQIPAASLPDDDAVLTRLCGLGRDIKTFRKHKAGALRGFVKCDDGRLYHPVVAEQALSAWSERSAYRERKAKRIEIARKAAASRWSTDDADASPMHNAMHDGMHDASNGDASCIDDAMLKGTGTGTGTGIKEEEAAGELPLPAPDGAQQKYAFAGTVVRLSEPDLAKWEKAYHAIPDLRAELTSLDAWFQGAGASKAPAWFHTASGALNRKHQDYLAARQRDGGTSHIPAGMPC